MTTKSKSRNKGSGRDNGKGIVDSFECREENTQLSFLRTVLDSIEEGVYLVDKKRKIIFWNSAAERITGYKKEDVEGEHCWNDILMHIDSKGCKRCNKACLLNMALKDGKPHSIKTHFHHKKGHTVPVWVQVIPVFEGGKVTGVFQTFRDNSNVLATEERVEELEQLAMLDPLTRIANRRYAEININARFEELHRYGWPFGIIFFDIDNFKNINDVHGHEVGDRVLQLVSDTVMRSLRPFDVLGRWGGDEFMAIVSNIDPEKLLALSERLAMLVKSSRLKNGEGLVNVTISVGVTLANENDNLESLYKRADGLLYKSKSAGKNKVFCDCCSI